jgi:SNF2 family DNA or RNA helicase
MKRHAPPLFQHQIESLDIMRRTPRVFDCSDPGTGKTRVQIELFALRNKRLKKKALVIAPLSLLEPAWESDFHKFEPSIRVKVCYAKDRAAAFAAPADVYVTNTDATTWLARQKPAFFKDFGTLIVDESSFFKHATSMRSKALNKIKKYFEYRSCLTGTPNSNTLLDIWNQINILDDGKRLGRSYYSFRSATCQPEQVGPSPQMVKWTPKEGAADAVAVLIKDITVRHKFEECVSIPPNFVTRVTYKMTPKQQKVYWMMEKANIALLAKGEVSAVNAAVQVQKLLQIASGAVYADSGEPQIIDTGRYKLIADLVDGRDKSLVFFNWAHQREALTEELTARDISFEVIDGTVPVKKRQEIVKHFQGGFYRCLLCHPQSAGHGLTLTAGTSTIWASPTYNLEHFIQANHRIYRAGQTQKTETVLVEAANTLEGSVYQKLEAKNRAQMDMLQILKDLTHAN